MLAVWHHPPDSDGLVDSDGLGVKPDLALDDQPVEQGCVLVDDQRPAKWHSDCAQGTALDQ